jgi:hypothetical protein
VADFGVDVVELQATLGHLSVVLEEFENSGYVVTSKLMQALELIMEDFEETFVLSQEELEELLETERGKRACRRRLSLPYLQLKSRFEEKDVDLGVAAKEAYRVYKRVRQGKMCLRADLVDIQLFLEFYKYVLVELLEEMETLDEKVPLLVLEHALDELEKERRQNDIEIELSASINELDEDDQDLIQAVMRLCQEKDLDEERLNHVLYVQELRGDIRQYSLFAVPPNCSLPLCCKFNEDGFPLEDSEVGEEVLNMLLQFPEIRCVANVNGSLVVAIHEGEGWTKGRLQLRILECILHTLAKNTMVMYENMRLMSLESEDDDAEGVGA